MSSINADTAKISEVAGQLGALADRLHKVVASHEAALTPLPAGSDEVSVRAAKTMNEVHTSFRTAADAGVVELREISRAVSTVSSAIQNADTDKGFHMKSDKRAGAESV
ncbi:PE family protein [Gordonia sp. ABSL1-1]|uniref:PE family protein n=1 Tax=Gordonia sp. ABSL1-1 TaxID=3053923 RepID=UPI002572C6E8|nr:PE family protein [Gordonia sp. ABSL1-1]MDL9937757.1 PE family protein [Gordonia sp. ABSL1-1]